MNNCSCSPVNLPGTGWKSVVDSHINASLAMTLKIWPSDLFLSPGALEEPIQVGSARLRQQKGAEVSPSPGTSHQAYPKEFFHSPQLSPQMFLQKCYFPLCYPVFNHVRTFNTAPSSVLSLSEILPPFSSGSCCPEPWWCFWPSDRSRTGTTSTRCFHHVEGKNLTCLHLGKSLILSAVWSEPEAAPAFIHRGSPSEDIVSHWLAPMWRRQPQFTRNPVYVWRISFFWCL